MKKVLILFPIIIICGLAFFYLYFRSNLKKVSDTTLIYNNGTGSWESIQNVPRILREEVNKDSNEDGLHNMSLLRGYFDHYDEKTNEIVMKAVLPFTMNSQYEEISLKAPPVGSVYCSPSITVDQKTGKEYATKNLTYVVKNDQTMNITKERLIGFNDFVRLANTENYLFIQLTQDFTKDDINYIKKLVVIGLCD